MKAATLKELENFFKTSESEYNVLEIGRAHV